MKKFIQPIKDKMIKIYYEEETEIDGSIKHYIHPINVNLKAYVRQLSAYEQNTAAALQDKSEIEFTINKRLVKPDMLVEFKGKTYKMSSPDNFEFYNTETKFRAYEIVPRKYDKIVGDDF